MRCVFRNFFVSKTLGRSVLLAVMFLLSTAPLAPRGGNAFAHTFVTDLTVREQAPPAICSQALAERLTPRCMAVRSYADEVMRMWWVASPDLTPHPAHQERQAFPELVPGALMGIMEITTTWYDYLDQPITHGVYTLRYFPAPDDPLHKGLLRWRDTLLLIPVLDDEIPGRAWAPQELQSAATDTTMSRHPRSMALFPTPMRKGPRRQDPPRLVGNEFDQAMLAFWLGNLPLSAVVSGSALPSNHE